MAGRIGVKADIGFIGGSGTFSIHFPEDLSVEGYKVLQKDLRFETPYGPSPSFKLFALEKDGRRILTVKMHGRMRGVSWGEASRRVFWVFREAGVKKVIAEGGVGSINHLLDLRDVVVPTDYIDFSLRRDVALTEDFLCIMRQAICPSLHRTLVEAAQHAPLNRVFDRGVYLVTEGCHFESPVETSVFRQWGADIVGQTLCPEVYLAREIGACYAGIYLVVNYGEGVVRPWEHRLLRDIFFQDAVAFGRIIWQALTNLVLEQNCGCPELRKPTLLREENIGRGAGYGI